MKIHTFQWFFDDLWLHISLELLKIAHFACLKCKNIEIFMKNHSFLWKIITSPCFPCIWGPLYDTVCQTRMVIHLKVTKHGPSACVRFRFSIQNTRTVPKCYSYLLLATLIFASRYEQYFHAWCPKPARFFNRKMAESAKKRVSASIYQ